jgi:hypothetical protein
LMMGLGRGLGMIFEEGSSLVIRLLLLRISCVVVSLCSYVVMVSLYNFNCSGVW